MARKIKADMTGVESFVKCGIGEHVAQIISAEEGVSQAGNDTINLKLKVLQGSSKGAQVYDTLAITEKAMWKIKGLLEAIGLKSEGKIVIDLDKIEKKTCIVEVIHEDYQGKAKAKIDGYKKLQASKTTDKDEEDDDFDEDDEDEEEEEKPKKSTKKKEEPKKKSKKAPEPEPEEEYDDDDFGEDDEEDEPEPPKKKEKKKASGKTASKPEKSSKKPTKKEPEEDEFEDDEDWDEE